MRLEPWVGLMVLDVILVFLGVVVVVLEVVPAGAYKISWDNDYWAIMTRFNGFNRSL